MNKKGIAILVWKQDEEHYANCIEGLRQLQYPAGYEVRVYTLTEQDTFTKQCNSVLAETDAKYKIYLSDEMRITAPTFVQDMLNIFADTSIGMIGFFGSTEMPLSANIMDAPHKYGSVLIPAGGVLEEMRFGEGTADAVADVRAILPSLFVTQNDLPWDADYTGQYYAVQAQCRNFTRHGYRVVVPMQGTPFCAYRSAEISFETEAADREHFFAVCAPYVDPAECDAEKHLLYDCGEDSAVQGWRNFSHPEGISIGAHTRIHETATCGLSKDNYDGTPRIVIGDNCSIGAYSVITATTHIEIENFVHVSENVHISDSIFRHRHLCSFLEMRERVDDVSEVCIGRATHIEENVSIRGNVHIGRGCLVRADSVVRSDIPDYCVAEGNPARVIEAFSAKTGTWQSVADEEELRALLRERKETRPILTYGIITYNRSKYLKKSLKSVLEQVGNDELVEVLVSDNCSEDDTKEVVREFQKKYKNLRYHCNETNVGAEGNIHEALRHSKGEYVITAGDDDYLADGMLYLVIDYIRRHRDMGIIFMANRNDEPFLPPYESAGHVDYILQVGCYMTWITCIVMNKDAYMSIQNPQRYNYTHIPQVYLQMEILKRKPRYAILRGAFLASGGGDHPASGFNFMEVFVKNYFDILAATVELPPEILALDKKCLIEELVLPWCEKITKTHIDLSFAGWDKILAEYYGQEPYYDRIVSEMKAILDPAGS
ncbi:glycosyltransferase [Selenomonas artemidis]|uniref:glycosyltransferase n=1 Tax=Selenomonas artemidis TaxID=671224 RepID=UPI0023F34D5A|nr:glycosyltransferase [Selenomonas artemidis]